MAAILSRGDELTHFRGPSGWPGRQPPYSTNWVKMPDGQFDLDGDDGVPFITVANL